MELKEHGRLTKGAAAVIAVIVMGYCGFAFADTWSLGKEGQLEAVRGDTQEGFSAAAAKVKQLIDNGQTRAAQDGLVKLKKDYPDAAGPDLDAFFEAEILFSERAFDKAMKKYDKFLNDYPVSDLYESAMEREFQIGSAYLNGQRRPVLWVFWLRAYEEGAKIMEKIASRAGDAPIAKRAMLAIVESQDRRGRYYEAYQTWSDISSRWATGDIGRDALLGMARCMHAAYKGPKYEAASLISARGYYREFKMRYPEYAAAIGVDKILEQIEEQIGYRQFTIGKYYAKTGSTQAANLYYQQVMENWPESKAAKFVEKAKQSQSSQGSEK